MPRQLRDLPRCWEGARKLVPNLPVREAITNFAGFALWQNQAATL